MSKGEETRQAILHCATQLASVHGLDGISVGGLASAMDMSKSGVFAHFRSKEALDVAVLEYVRDRFLTDTLLPSFKAKRGLARIHALRDRMVDWMHADWLPGGCPMLPAGFELDDKPGAARDIVVAAQRDLLSAIAQSARIAVDEGELDPQLDVEQFAFEVHGAILASHQAMRLRRDPRATERFRRAVDRVIDDARLR
ncbi:MAG: TetR/AcrR family transcriptional regulator [Myxococcales bacterium]|nr:TetR/AcrR family transcriptional regulator [Myxococcales bacterium]MCB9627471.1 TetR/AcrR family transcriptional regulator [Sandaracinaceae bacterium]